MSRRRTCWIALAVGLSVACAGGRALADSMSSANYQVTSSSVMEGVSAANASNASVNSANYYTQIEIGQGLVSTNRQLTSASYNDSCGHLVQFWGLGTRYDTWIGANDGGSTQTTTGFANAFNWGFGTPSAAWDVEVATARAYPIVSAAASTAALTLDAGTSLSTSGSGTTLTTAGTVTVSGGAASLSLGNGTTLSLGNGQTLSILAGGSLVTSGTSGASRATISSAGTYSVTLGGTMNTSWMTVSNLGAGGIVVQSTATITGWTGMTFSNGAAGGVYVDLSQATSATTLPTYMQMCTFNAGPAYNCKGGGTSTTASKVTFLNWSGAMGGEAHETNDPLDLIEWGSTGGVVLRNAASDVATYSSLNDAVAAATAANNIIEVRDNVIRSETLNLSGMAFSITIDGAILSPPNGQVAVTGSGNNTMEILQNCVFVRPSGSTAALVQNVGRMFHCDLLGSNGEVNPLAVYSQAGGTYIMYSCILGDPTSWAVAGSADPSVTAGTLNVYYSDIEGAGTWAGTHNLNSNPLFVNYAPAGNIYDVHLTSTSPCIDYAASPTSIGQPDVTTSYDRGNDFENPGTNPRRPIDDPNTANVWGTYDVGAVEFGPLTCGSPATPQGIPVWVKETGAQTGSNADVLPVTDFAPPYVLISGDNIDMTGGGANKQMIRVLNMNTGALISSFDVGSALPSVRRIVYMTVTRDLVTSTKDDIYLVVATTAAPNLFGDSIVALAYDSATQTVSQRAGWTNPTNPGGGNGRMGRIVIDRLGDLYVVNGRSFYHLVGTTGAGYSNTWWAADGHNTWFSGNGGWSDAVYDIDGGMVSDRFNDVIQVPMNAGIPDQVWRMTISTGARANNANTTETSTTLSAGVASGAATLPVGSTSGFAASGTVYVGGDSVAYTGTTATSFTGCTGVNSAHASGTTVSFPYEKNHSGFTQIGGRLYLTPTQTDFVVARFWNNLNPVTAWSATGQSADLGTWVTTRASTLLRSDADVRVGAGNYIFKIRKDTGQITSDSVAGTDWGTSRTLRGNINTTPFTVGSKSLTGAPTSYVDGRVGSKLFFGTDQGCCYVLSYIRNTTGNTDATGDYQPAAPASSTYDVTDGRPYPGYPYRIPGQQIAQVLQGYSTAIGRNLLIFVMDNGWIYAFPEPY